MATLDNITHDSGSPLSNHWTSVVDTAARMSVTIGAALNGSVEGLQVDYAASGATRLNEPFTSPVSEELNLIFYFDPNGAGTPTSASRTLMIVSLNDDGSPTGFGIIQTSIIKRTDGIIRVSFSFSEDGGGGGSAGTFDITDAPHKFQMTSKRATSDVASDGEYAFYVDDALKFSATGVDNFDLFPTIDFIYVQFNVLEAAMSGTTIYADEFLLTDAGVAITAFRFLGFDADNENLYASGLKDAATLQLFDYDLPTLTEAGTASFGSGTDAELDALTRGVFPVIKPMADQVLYLRGRDGNNVQVQHNDQNGTLGWVDLGPGTATWGTAKYAVGLLTAPTYTDDVIAVFSDDDVYRTRFGTVTWVKMGDAGGGLRAAARQPNRFNEIIAGGTAAGTVEWSNNFGATFGDVSGTILGTVNAFEVSL